MKLSLPYNKTLSQCVQYIHNTNIHTTGRVSFYQYMKEWIYKQSNVVTCILNEWMNTWRELEFLSIVQHLQLYTYYFLIPLHYNRHLETIIYRVQSIHQQFDKVLKNIQYILKTSFHLRQESSAIIGWNGVTWCHKYAGWWHILSQTRI